VRLKLLRGKVAGPARIFMLDKDGKQLHLGEDNYSVGPTWKVK